MEYFLLRVEVDMGSFEYWYVFGGIDQVLCPKKLKLPLEWRFDDDAAVDGL
jgi:hypothetical protein